METLSSSPLTTFQVHKPTKPNHLPNLKTPIHHHPSATTKTTAKTTISTLQQKDNYTLLNSYHGKRSILRTLTRTSTPPRASTHRRAASGYAAALLDISQCNDNVPKVEKDVRRLLKVMRNDQVKEFMMDAMVDEKLKGEVMKQLVDKGKFEKNFVGLVKLVVDKGQSVELIKEVLEEFLRVFSQLAPGFSMAV